MFDPVIAPSGTLLGLLQRGRGDGTLHALTAPRAEALAALDHCVLHDPRHDWQVENRSLYYARLYLDLQRRAGRDRGAPLRPRGRPRHRRVAHRARPRRPRPPRLLRQAGRARPAAPVRRPRRQLGLGPGRAGPARRRRGPARPRRARPGALPAPTRRARPSWPPPYATPSNRGPGACGPTTRANRSPRACVPPTRRGSFDRWQRQMRPTRPASGLERAGRLRVGPAGHRARQPRSTCPPPAASPPSRAPRTGPRSSRPPADGTDGARCTALRYLADSNDPDALDLIEAAAVTGSTARSWRPPSTPSSGCAASPPSTAPAAGLHRPDAARRRRRTACSPAGARRRTRDLVLAALREAVRGEGPDAPDPVDPRRRHRTASASPAPPRCCATSTARPPPPICAAGPPAPWPPPTPRSPPGFAVECLWDCEETTREIAARHAETGDARVRRAAAQAGRRSGRGGRGADGRTQPVRTGRDRR